MFKKRLVGHGVARYYIITTTVWPPVYSALTSVSVAGECKKTLRHLLAELGLRATREFSRWRAVEWMCVATDRMCVGIDRMCVAIDRTCVAIDRTARRRCVEHV